MTKILAFAGRKQSGKDTLGREALRRLAGTRLYAFAGPLKDICQEVLGIDGRLLYGSDADKATLTDIRRLDGSGPMTAREVLQYVGTEVFRAMRPGCWPAACLRRIAVDSPTNAIITDCRFPDEVVAVRAAGGKVVRLTRGMHGDAHESERALDPDQFDWNIFDSVIDNANLGKREQAAALVGLLKLWGWM